MKIQMAYDIDDSYTADTKLADRYAMYLDFEDVDPITGLRPDGTPAKTFDEWLGV